MNFVKILFLSLLSLMIIFALSAPVITASADETAAFDDDIDNITSKAAIVIEFATGLVIFEMNADELRVPASMTKLAAVYVIFDAVRDGIVSLDSPITISEDVSTFSYDRGYTNVPLPPDSSYTARELLSSVIIRSACAATVALGEGIFGSEEALIIKMNEKAASLGIDAIFHDCWGGSPDNKISARGTAKLAISIIREYPEILDYASEESVIFDEVKYNSTNLLLGSYEGIDGLKTGFTNPAGWCFTGSAYRDGHRIISVTMGSRQGHRFPDTVVLLDHGFANHSKMIANHFKEALRLRNPLSITSSPLVPAMMYNIEEAKHLGMRELAIALNGN